MPDLHQLRGDAAGRLANLIDAATPDDGSFTDLADAFPAVHAIAEYTLALALDRLAKAGCNASADRLASAILAKQPQNLPFGD